ncbi:MAG: hypothetical protein ACPG4N_02205 [Gammaproteobacteria bacterium]
MKHLVVSLLLAGFSSALLAQPEFRPQHLEPSDDSAGQVSNSGQSAYPPPPGPFREEIVTPESHFNHSSVNNAPALPGGDYWGPAKAEASQPMMPAPEALTRPQYADDYNRAPVVDPGMADYSQRDRNYAMNERPPAMTMPAPMPVPMADQFQGQGQSAPTYSSPGYSSPAYPSRNYPSQGYPSGGYSSGAPLPSMNWSMPFSNNPGGWSGMPWGGNNSVWAPRGGYGDFGPAPIPGEEFWGPQGGLGNSYGSGYGNGYGRGYPGADAYNWGGPPAYNGYSGNYNQGYGAPTGRGYRY